MPSDGAGASSPKIKTVACLGSSSTASASRGLYDWIGDLKRLPGNESLVFRVFAAGGDLAYNGLRRLPDIVECHPDYVVVLLGGNDVIAMISGKKFTRLSRILMKHAPTNPSPTSFRENMLAIVRGLKGGTPARIGLCSFQPFGEDPSPGDPFQAEANRLAEELNAMIKEVATEEAVSYIPFYERMRQLILASPGRAYTSFDILPFYRDLYRQWLLRKSNDEIGRMNGWKFHRDGIHLNSVSGKLLADLVQEFLQAGPGFG